MSPEEERVAFQAGVVFAINKLQEMLANGAELKDIEKEASKMLEDILKVQAKILQ